mmetsp:Transcript_50475/g.163379  ORF Transcript_50475/g.163379 Transcript_50475/m.163379 type:complete len:436 (-) Transcript_50475:115-1422(-)
MAASSSAAGTREKAQYTGELTKAAVRRVQSEQLDFQKHPMYEDGIFFQCGDQLHSCKALIIGPPDTPYQYGFYLFDIKYPNTYPWDPPQVTFMTSDRRVRLNPNLYVGGKVCLSILGTWSGPPWTPGLTLRTVMLSIQSLLHSHPLQNEPAFAKVTGERDDRYSRILSYENIAVSVLRMLEYTPEGFDPFRPHMGYYFLRSYDVYKAVLGGFARYQGQEEESPLGAFKTVYDPGTCSRCLEDWVRRIRGDASLMQRVGQLEAEMRVQVPSLPSVLRAPVPSSPSGPSAPVAPPAAASLPQCASSASSAPWAGAAVVGRSGISVAPPVPPSPPPLPKPTAATPPAGAPPSAVGAVTATVGGVKTGGALSPSSPPVATAAVAASPASGSGAAAVAEGDDVVISTSEAPDTSPGFAAGGGGLRGLCRCFSTAKGRTDA